MILLCWDKISDHNHVLLRQDFVWQHVRWVTTFSGYPVEVWKNTNVNELIWFLLLQQCNDNLALTQIPLRLSLCLPENQLWRFHRNSNNITLSSPFIYIVHVAIGNFFLVCGKIKCLSEVFFFLWKATGMSTYTRPHNRFFHEWPQISKLDWIWKNASSEMWEVWFLFQLPW